MFKGDYNLLISLISLYNICFPTFFSYKCDTHLIYTFPYSIRILKGRNRKAQGKLLIRSELKGAKFEVQVRRALDQKIENH